MQFCTTERPQLFEFEVVSCRTCRLRSKKAILEVAMSNFEKMTRLSEKLGSLHANLTPPNLHPRLEVPLNLTYILFDASNCIAFNSIAIPEQR